jgi:hypothetical protein
MSEQNAPVYAYSGYTFGGGNITENFRQLESVLQKIDITL